MTPLSPAAQAVDRAIAASIQMHGEMIHAQHIAAAVLRAAVEQCNGKAHRSAGMGNAQDWETHLLDIATELENEL